VAFRGTFDLTLDAKNRLTVPSKLRAFFADGVVLAAGFEPCVGVWVPEDYDRWTQSMLAGRDPFSPAVRKLQRHFNSNALATELDGAGRVMVPRFLMEYAGLEREVSLVGTGPALELWERERWTSYNADVSSNVAGIAAALGSYE
jgi:MraZ protein